MLPREQARERQFTGAPVGNGRGFSSKRPVFAGFCGSPITSPLFVSPSQRARASRCRARSWAFVLSVSVIRGESAGVGLQQAPFDARESRRPVYGSAGTPSASDSLRSLRFTASRHLCLFAPRSWRKKRPDGEHRRATMKSTPRRARPATWKRGLLVRDAARSVVADSATTEFRAWAQRIASLCSRGLE
jgi:hypothetical protein